LRESVLCGTFRVARGRIDVRVVVLSTLWVLRVYSV